MHWKYVLKVFQIVYNDDRYNETNKICINLQSCKIFWDNFVLKTYLP